MEQRNILPPGPDDGHALSLAAVTARLARQTAPGRRSDWALEHGDRPGSVMAGQHATPAAVLVPLVEHQDGLTVLLTKRTAHLAHHPGQISFPGGRLENQDRGDFVACALRETAEEVGLHPASVTVIGRLDDYVTGTGFVISPIVGVLRPPLTTHPDPFEVAEIFEVPLSFLMHTDNRSLEDRVVAGRSRPFWAIPWQGRLIWGATAGILVNLSDVLRDP